MSKRVVTKYKKQITQTERTQILGHTVFYSPGVRLAVHLLDGLGLRVSEAVSVNVADIDFRNKILNVNIENKQRKIIQRAIPDKLMCRINVHIKQYSHLIREGYLCFPNGKWSKRLYISKNTICYFFTDCRRGYGYDKPYYIRKDGRPLYRVSTHVMRANWITRYFEASKDIVQTKDVIGHEKIETTAGYTRFHNIIERSRSTVNAIV